MILHHPFSDLEIQIKAEIKIEIKIRIVIEKINNTCDIDKNTMMN